MVQEYNYKGTYTYFYTDQDSYELLTQIIDYSDKTKPQEINYFHCDQIGIPREMTDKDGNVIWTGIMMLGGNTGLHYNLFRYYDPKSGRFRLFWLAGIIFKLIQLAYISI